MSQSADDAVVVAGGQRSRCGLERQGRDPGRAAARSPAASPDATSQTSTRRCRRRAAGASGLKPRRWPALRAMVPGELPLGRRRSQWRSTPGSSTDQSVPSGAKARASRSPSVWNGRRPITAQDQAAVSPSEGGTVVELMAWSHFVGRTGIRTVSADRLRSVLEDFTTVFRWSAGRAGPGKVRLVRWQPAPGPVEWIEHVGETPSLRGEFAYIDWLRRRTPSARACCIGPGDDAAALRLADRRPAW